MKSKGKENSLTTSHLLYGRQLITSSRIEGFEAAGSAQSLIN